VRKRMTARCFINILNLQTRINVLKTSAEADVVGATKIFEKKLERRRLSVEYNNSYDKCPPLGEITLSHEHFDPPISVQAPRKIFVGRFPRFGRLISRSADSNVQIDFIYPTCHALLLPLIFISLRIIIIQLTDGHSKFAIEVGR
jgi:hypothetical protein